MKLLEFIFQSFWHFIGFIIIITILYAFIFDGISDIIKAFKNNNKNDTTKS